MFRYYALSVPCVSCFPDVSSGAAGRKRKRKSRWGETPSTTTTTEEDSQIATAMASFSPSPSPSSSQLPQQQLTVDQQHQLQEQIEVRVSDIVLAFEKALKELSKAILQHLQYTMSCMYMHGKGRHARKCVRKCFDGISP